jgi:hypothetical protein
MKKAQIAITIVTLYLLIYSSAQQIGIAESFIFTMFFISPFMVAGMVYIVLKYGEPSKYNFDERFYDDLDYERNGKEEMGQ